MTLQPGARLYLPHTRLQRWKNNMRVRYPLNDVRRMGLSQAERARQGKDPCVHDLVITPGPGLRANGSRPHLWYIVAGHLRHAGNAWLGAKAPPLNCRVEFYADEAEMLADMSAENGVRSEPSPLGWARHYQRAFQTRKLGVIARESGKSVHYVQTHLALLELSDEAQQALDRGDLPFGAVEYLAKIDDRGRQAAVAKRLAERHATLEQVAYTVNGVLAGYSRRGKKNKAHPTWPSTDRLPAVRSPVRLADLRAGAAQTCAACDLRRQFNLVEPAWHLALAAAGDVCGECSIQTLKGACAACPLAEMMLHVARAAKKDGLLSLPKVAAHG